MKKRAMIGLAAAALLAQSSYILTQPVACQCVGVGRGGQSAAGSNYVALLYGLPSPDALRPALNSLVGDPLEPVPFRTGGLSGYL